jgi:hypothetical protein
VNTWRVQFSVRLVVLAGVFSLTMCSSTPAWSATCRWVGASGGAWTAGSSWDTGLAPAAGDVVLFDGTAAAVTAVPSITLQRLRVINGAGITLKASGGALLTLSGGTNPSLEVGTGSSLTLDAGVAADSIRFAIRCGARSRSSAPRTGSARWPPPR